MQRVHTVAEVRAAEAALIKTLPEHELMHRAAFGLAVEVAELLRSRHGRAAGARVVGLIGPGNNGSDTLWAMALLAARGVGVEAVDVTGQRRADLTDQLFAAAGGRWRGLSECRDADLYLDGIAGLGSNRPVAAEVVEFVARQRQLGALVVAVDLPSGVDADAISSASGDGSIEADFTVTFGSLKPCHVLDPELDACGEVLLVDIGLDGWLATPKVHAAGDELVAQLWPWPQRRDSKYSRGTVNIVAGSAKYPGAGLLASRAARWGGAGLVRHVGAGATFETASPSIVLEPDSRIGTAADAYVVGCGLDESADSRKSVKAVLKTSQTVVMDAEALNWIARDEKLRARLTRREGLTVLTPHGGEFARLCRAFEVGFEPSAANALALARASNAVVYLKGSIGVVATPEGELVVTRRTSEHLAVAGTGDVLAGLLGSLLAAIKPAGNWTLALATAAAVLAHSMAAELVADDGEPLTAEELEEELPAALAELEVFA